LISSARVFGVDAPVRFRLRTADACLPSAVRVSFGMWAMVFLRLAELIALRTFFFAAFRCLMVTTAHLLRALRGYLPRCGRRNAAGHASAAATRCTTAVTMAGPSGMRASTFVNPKPRTARPTRTTMKSMYRVAFPPFCVKVVAIS